MTQEKNPDLFLRNVFREYYQNWNPVPVDLIHQREIGFIPFMGTMIRHRSINGMNELKLFSQRNIPRHLYYSTSYYRYPDRRIMSEKEWMGAELIFDLDADHIKLEGSPRYDQILDKVREHTVRLLEKFLLDDIGFSENDILVTFSGGRGYHIHIKADSVYGLSSDSRREISNYVRGEGMDIPTLQYGMKSEPGISGIWRKAVDNNFTGMFAGDQDSIKSKLQMVFGDGRKSVPYLQRLKKTSFSNSGKSKLQAFSEPGPEKYASMDEEDRLVLGKAVEIAHDSLMCEIDEPVTTDIHRLIRMPGSLHGKTGLMVVPVSPEALRSFDPLVTCRSPTMADRYVDVIVNKTYSIKFGGQLWSLSEGKESVPLDLGVFLLAQRVANLV